MAIDLSEHEAAPKVDGDAAARTATAIRRLAQAQAALVAHRRRAMIVVEGWDGAGKGGAIRRLVGAWDPRDVAVFAIGAPTEAERARHPLARFWERVPPAGVIHVFERSWYGALLDGETSGDRTAFRRACDAINEFEAQQVDQGTTLIKLFLHVTEEEQRARLAARVAHPWKRARVTPAMLDGLAHRAERLAAAHAMFAQTDTRWAPWRVVDANGRRHARLTVLEHVGAVLTKALPSDPPPPDPALLAAARAAGLPA